MLHPPLLEGDPPRCETGMSAVGNYRDLRSLNLCRYPKQTVANRNGYRLFWIQEAHMSSKSTIHEPRSRLTLHARGRTGRERRRPKPNEVRTGRERRRTKPNEVRTAANKTERNANNHFRTVGSTVRNYAFARHSLIPVFPDGWSTVRISSAVRIKTCLRSGQAVLVPNLKVNRQELKCQQPI